MNFSVTGWDLTFVDGLLSGYLLDGNWFSNQFSFGSSWAGTFTINASQRAESGITNVLTACRSRARSGCCSPALQG